MRAHVTVRAHMTVRAHVTTHVHAGFPDTLRATVTDHPSIQTTLPMLGSPFDNTSRPGRKTLPVTLSIRLQS